MIYRNYNVNHFIKICIIINIKKEKDDLATKEAKLNTLISPEEKRRLDIEALSKELEN